MIHQFTDKAIGVEVPADATNFSVQDLQDWEFCLSYKHGGDWPHIDLPHPGPVGPFVILGRPEEMTREQCDRVMEGYDGSLYTLLKSKGLNPETTLILIKQ